MGGLTGRLALVVCFTSIQLVLLNSNALKRKAEIEK